MKRSFVLLILVLSFLLAFAGAASAVVMEEPLELKEGEVGITAVGEDPNSPVASDEIRTTEERPSTTIPGMDGKKADFEGTPEEAEQIRTLAPGADSPEAGTATSNYLHYAAAALVFALLVLYAIRKRTPATSR